MTYMYYLGYYCLIMCMKPYWSRFFFTFYSLLLLWNFIQFWYSNLDKKEFLKSNFRINKLLFEQHEGYSIRFSSFNTKKKIYILTECHTYEKTNSGNSQYPIRSTQPRQHSTTNHHAQHILNKTKLNKLV